MDDYYLSETPEIPNNPLFPLLVYRQALTDRDLAKGFERMFSAHGWDPAWRDGILPYAHYHSTAHEVLGVFRGTATVLFGHTGGVTINLEPGDAVVIPAGTGHQCLISSPDFQVVGAYPHGSKPDLIRAELLEKGSAKFRIDAVPLPALDPVFAANGPLVDLW